MTDIFSELCYGGQVPSTSFSSPTSTNSSNLIRFNQPPKELNERYHNMHTVIANLRSKKNRNFRSLSRVHAIQDLFDATRTADLVSFIVLGGLDAVVEILCDDNLFNFGITTPAEARFARIVCQDYIRLVDEMIIVNGNIVWYVLTNYPKFAHRVVVLMELDKVRDRCISLIEHFVSFCGPLYDVTKCNEINKILFGTYYHHSHHQKHLISKSSDVLFSRITRVLSISIVPMVVAGSGADIENPAPYPQSWGSRTKIFHEIAFKNSEYLSQEEILKRIVQLLDYSRDTRRNAPATSSSSRGGADGGDDHNNNSLLRPRTVTDENGQQMQAVEISLENLQHVMQQTTGSGGGGGGGGASNNNTTNNNPAAAGSSNNNNNVFEMLRMLQILSGGQMQLSGVNGNQLQVELGVNDNDGGPQQLEDEDEEEEGDDDNDNDQLRDFEIDDDDDNGGGDGQQLNQLQQLLSGLQSGATNNSFGFGGDDDQEEEDDGDFRAAGELNAADNAMLFSRFLNDLALENANNQDDNNGDSAVDDSAAMDWLSGEPDVERLWRLNHHQLRLISDPSEIPSEWISSAKNLISTVLKLAPTENEEKEAKLKKEKMEEVSVTTTSSSLSSTSLPKQQKATSLSDKKTIVAAHSEMLYLLAGLLTGPFGTQVWFHLDKLKLGEKLFKLLNWFVEVQPTISSVESKAQEISALTNNSSSLPELEFDFEKVFSTSKSSSSSSCSLNDDCRILFQQLNLQHLLRREGRRRELILKEEVKLRHHKIVQKEFVENATVNVHQQQQEQEQEQQVEEVQEKSISISNDDDEKKEVVDKTQQQEIVQNNNNNDDYDDDDGAASVATSIEPSTAGHHHTIDVLAKIETLRVLQEFWDARSYDQAAKIQQSHIFSSSSSSLNLADQLFDLVIKFIRLGRADDPCVENMSSFCVEARLRALCISDREQVQNKIMSEICFPLLDRLILRSPTGIRLVRKAGIPISGALPPGDISIVFHRRLEGVMTLIGDACRYNLSRGWSVFNHWVCEREMIPFLRNRLLSCPQHMSHFLRAFFLTQFQDMCCPFALTISSSSSSSSKTSSEEEYIMKCQQSYEPSWLVTKRIFSVRQRLDYFSSLLVSSSLKSKQKLADEIISKIEEISSEHSHVPKSDQIKWFSSDPNNNNNNKASSCISSAPSSESNNNHNKKEKLVEERKQRSIHHFKNLMKNLYCPELFSLIESLRVPVLARLMTTSIPEDVETNDKLSPITTSMIILGGILFSEGEEALDKILSRICRHHKRRREKAFYKLKQKRAEKKLVTIMMNNNNIDDGNDGEEDALFKQLQKEYLGSTSNNDDKTPKDCDRDIDDSSNSDSDSGSEEEKENQHHEKNQKPSCLHCGSVREIQKNVLRVPCLAKCFFEGMCLWISHYATHPVNFHVVYYTTQLDSDFYQNTIRVLFKLLAKRM